MRAHHHVRFIGPARRVGHVGRDRLVVEHHAPAVRQLARQQLALRASAQAGVGLQLARGHRRQERIGVDLPVRMMQRDAHLDAAVLERQHVVHLRARPQLEVAVAPDPHQRFSRARKTASRTSPRGRRCRPPPPPPRAVRAERESGYRTPRSRSWQTESRWARRLARRTQRTVVGRRQERALLAFDRINDLLAAQLVEAQLVQARLVSLAVRAPGAALVLPAGTGNGRGSRSTPAGEARRSDAARADE